MSLKCILQGQDSKNLATKAELSYVVEQTVPKTRKINNFDLSADRTLTGENIAVSTADSTPISSAIKYRTNPNLLDNWYFGNPINQRGQTEYTAPLAYCIDRWVFEAVGAGKVTLTPSGIQIQSLSGSVAPDMYQKMSQAILDALRGRVVTFSALATSAEDSGGYIQILDITGGPSAYTKINGPGLVTVTAKIPDSATEETIRFVMAAYWNKKIRVSAAKLELGLEQTLAHKEGDTWVLNEIPNYAEQLARCQRYFYRVNDSHAFGWVYSASVANLLIPLPVTMRTKPAITFSRNGELHSVSGAVAVTGFESKGVTANGVMVDIHNSDSRLTTGTPVVLHNFSADISADL